MIREQLDREQARKLLQITEGCSASMHEPDEQGLTALLVGQDPVNGATAYLMGRLDNAGVDGELLVRFNRDHAPIGGLEVCDLNLADLIALARVGAATVLWDEILEGRLS